jgi:dihydroorotase
MVSDRKLKTKSLLGIKNMLIKSANIVDPAIEKEFKSDILIENGIIKDIGSGIKGGSLVDFKEIFKESRFSFADNLLLIDATDYSISPGFFDMHVHLRDPGNEDEENLESGINSALKGGITAVACMPNTDPPIDKDFLVKYINNRALALGFKVYPVAAITKRLEGIEMTEMGILKECGAIAFSDDGKCIQDAKLMYEIMKYCRNLNIPLILHEEDYTFSCFGLINEGYYSSMLGLDGISPLAEELVITRDIMLAKKTRAQIHITHVSTKGSVELIKKAKEDGLNITCDVTPHHLYFDDSHLKDYNTNLKVNPPLRSSEDREALIEGVRSGIIDAIASDHAPHLESEKNTTFKEASNGVIGMETLFKASYTQLCKKDNLSFIKLIKLLTLSPPKILGLNSPLLKLGLKADIAILDLEKEVVVKKEDFYSKSSNCAFIGEKLAGEVIMTINNGEIRQAN